MKFTQMFSRVKTMEADEARRWMDERPEKSYTLLDVRQPEEYEQGHIPGGLLIPLSELPQRMAELDVTKPVLAY
jgi:rhodanese-related sulfurtransferase